jgi:anaerobic magnesium-protoporphyrin IX monomethyl ester cyclase
MKPDTVILFYPFVEKSNHNQNIPYSLLYIERAIRDLNIKIILLDERIHPNYEEIIIKNKDRILLSGVSCMIGYQIVGALRFTELIKKHTNSPVLWGGWFPTAFSEIVLREKSIDYICIGQGEIPLRELTLNLLNKKVSKKVSGIITNIEQLKDYNKMSFQSHNKLPEIKLELIDINKIIDINGQIKKGFRGTDYIATMGCPYNCSFCNLPYIYDKKWFHMPINHIISHIIYLKKNADINHITFSDDNFFVNKSFVIDFCNKLMERNISITWEANAHVKLFLNHFKDNDIALIRKAGCVKIKFGAESGDQDILVLINKKITVEDNFRMLKKLKKHDISARIYTMVAFPTNPQRDTKLTFSFITKAKLMYPNIDVNINIFKPVPKTALFELAQKHGFNYPETIPKLLDFLNKEMEFPWHKKNYNKLVHVYSNVYYHFLGKNICTTKSYIYEKIGCSFMKTLFYLPTLLRLKINYWDNQLGPLFYLFLINKRYKSNNIENVGITKLRRNT